MISKIASLHRRATRVISVISLTALLTSTTAIAGTPLICHPYTIGAAKSLPGSDGDWKGVNPNYDRTNLVRDTLALLTSETPIIVRMETLRRAAIYATAGMRGWSAGGFNTEDRANTAAILEKLQARAKTAIGPARALALFDVGFYTETLRHTGIDKTINGYDTMIKALELRGGPDPEMEFALALATSWPKQGKHQEHLARARAGAKEGSLLASNLASHFSSSANTPALRDLSIAENR